MACWAARSFGNPYHEPLPLPPPGHRHLMQEDAALRSPLLGAEEAGQWKVDWAHGTGSGKRQTLGKGLPQASASGRRRKL